MNKRFLCGVTILAIIVGFLIWHYSDAQVIKRKSNTLIDTLNITGSETRSFRLLKTGSFTNLLARSVICRVNLVNYRSDYSYDELEAQHHLFVHNVDTSSVTASNMAVSIIGDGSAEVTAELSLSLTGKNDAGFSEAGKLALLWKKDTAGKWHITKLVITSRNR